MVDESNSTANGNNNFFFSLNLLATTTNQRLELLIGSTKIKSLVHLCNKKKNNRNKLK